MRINGFINRFGLKKSEKLERVELVDINIPNLPFRDVTIHYHKEGIVDTSTIAKDFNYLNAHLKKGYMSLQPHVEFERVVGRGKPLVFNAQQAVNHRVNTFDFMAKCKDFDKEIEQNNRVVVNDYTFLTQMFEYASYPYNIHDEWYNIFNQLVKGIEKVDGRKTNIVWMELPRLIPELTKFKRSLDEVIKGDLPLWNSYNGFCLLELYRFMMGKGLLSNLSQESIDKTVLMVMDGDKVTYIPLNKLREEDLEDYSKTSPTFRERFYKVFQLFEDARSVQDTEVIDDLVLTDLDTSTKEDRSNTPYVKQYVRELSEAGILSTPEKNRIEKLVQAQEGLKDPDTGKSIYDEVVVSEKDEVIEKKILTPLTNVINEGYLESSMKNWDKNYVERGLMDKHLKQMFLSFPKGGAMITNMEKELDKDLQNDQYVYTMDIQPIEGRKSTARFVIPRFDEDGTFLSAGVRYSLDTQRRDLPIRKLKPFRAALTSYAGKLFIDRNQMKAYNTLGKMVNKVIDLALGSDSPYSFRQFGAVKKIPHGNKLPLHYTALGESFLRIDIRGFKFNFDWHKRSAINENYSKLESKGKVLCGTFNGKSLLMDVDGYLSTEEKGVFEHIEHVLTGGEITPIVNFAEIGLLGKSIPVGLALCYHLGITKLLKLLKVKVEYFEAGKRIEKDPFDVIISCKDKTLVIKRPPMKHRLVLNGFVRVAKELRQVTLGQLDKKSVYGTLVTKFRGTTYNLKEFELANNMFLDPITTEILGKMKEPTKFIPLLLRACELLESDDVPDENDTHFVKFAGLERVAGMVFAQIYESMRAYHINPNRKLAKVDIKPYGVRATLTGDAMTVDDINPIHVIKESHAVTLGGEGGRSAVTLVKSSRAYHPNDLGVISEATPDSSKAGMRTHTSPNAKIDNIYGIREEGSFDPKKDKSTSLTSTTALLYPGLNHDDAKRVNLCSVITSSMVAAKGYKLHPWRTGYEQVIGSMAKNSFAHNFHDNGVVDEVTKDRIVIKDSKGELHGIPLGVQHGISGGAVLPHEIKTTLSKGDKVKKGDIVAYNADYFIPDEFNPGNVTLLTGVPLYVAFMEGEDTFEDASSINQALLPELVTKDTKRKVITLDKDDRIDDLVSVGDTLEENDPYCSIQKVFMGKISKEEKGAFETLEKFGANVPKCKVNGTVSKIEVFYCGEYSEFDDTVKVVIDNENKRLRSIKRHLDKEAVTKCELVRPGFVYGNKIEVGQCAIVVYTDYELGASPGDKVVLGAQLKSVLSDTMSPKTRTKSGKPVGMLFSYAGEANRIVLSTRIQGTGGLIMKELSERAAEAFFS